MMKRRFAILDVFTDQARAGNQLGVVFDSEGLDGEAMQSIAREFNFPETIFLLPAENEAHTAKVRIFTPGTELPFAGHPTVGAAIALSLEDAAQGPDQRIVVLEEKVGPVRCGVRLDGQAAFAEFDLPVVATLVKPSPSDAEIALALGLDPADIGFENHRPAIYDGGLAYQLIPVRDLAAVAKATPNPATWTDVINRDNGWSAYVYCRECVGHDNHFHARMFAPADGIPEDPATGSAVASLAGAIAEFDQLGDGKHEIRIEQGIEMGRPSLITLGIDIEDGAFQGGRIGGHAVVFARGYLEDS
ncbi:MAG: PhzF family phenazine biosynthesis protein [Pseudomonadota bacterium]